MHNNYVRLINPVSFSGKKYFFIFIDNASRMTDTYTKIKKSNWLKNLKIYYSLCKTRSKKDHTIEKLKLNYKSKQKSHKRNK